MSDDDFKKFLGAVARGTGNVAVARDQVGAISALRFYGAACLDMSRVDVELPCRRCGRFHDGDCR